MTSFVRELRVYVGRVREFSRRDWLAYAAWVGLIFGLFAATASFLLAGRAHGVRFPDEAWLVPAGAGVFTLAVAIDTIGHRTVYRQALAGGEALVHQITSTMGIASCVLLCAAYPQRSGLAIAALVLTLLSVVYSFVDEVFHWRRYVRHQTDRVEMWSHVLILVGHLTMMAAWWRCYQLGYPGVAETIAALGGAPVAP
jgi:hypothetical protein